MEIPFSDNELLYRAVLPNGVFWKPDGTLSSAAFKTRPGENGISVDRQMGRSNKEAVAFILGHLKGKVVAVSVSDVHDCQAEVHYDPIPKENKFHSLIIKNINNPRLTQGQSKELAKAAKLVYSG